MSDYHIGLKTDDSRYVTVYVHLPIPDTVNVAGSYPPVSDPALTYQRALKESLQFKKDAQGNVLPVTQIPDYVTSNPTEYAQLVAGVLYESAIQFRFSSTDLTNAERRAEIEGGNDNESGVAQMKADISDPTSELYGTIISLLEWWGYYRDVEPAGEGARMSEGMSEGVTTGPLGIRASIARFLKRQ